MYHTMRFELIVYWNEQALQQEKDEARGKVTYDNFTTARKEASAISLSPIVAKVQVIGVVELGQFIDGIPDPV